MVIPVHVRVGKGFRPVWRGLPRRLCFVCEFDVVEVEDGLFSGVAGEADPSQLV
jgi:hypothetical protein